MIDHRFYVGPIGALTALPDVYTPVAAPVTRVGFIHLARVVNRQNRGLARR